ncbi:WW domain-binding 4 [Chlorella sorokiniana]|uniref:WW domain-binding 4 n=1 Tax=Chlorella sorokiniana TaxID=3076 RepID=A0A2P6TXE4_CHLSO|nr:WW domain-binding 4 [Chlorella sorokiniana]|eukprot:PRW58735.1 WW domain-binding 4 [Chlorella sorokiniana]
MTEFWVSQANKWCEYCRVWLKDSAQSWAVHERGAKHQENVARKLREMRQKADQEKKDQAELESSMQRVEAEALKKFEADRKAEEEHRKATLGSWEWNEGAGYYYNSLLRWYYDASTRMYYGGEPVEWTDTPSIPHEARYEVMHKPAAPKAAAAGGGASAAAAGGGGAAARPAGQQQYAVAGSRIVNKHPLADLGGYQLHSIEGSIGGAKGVGTLHRGGGGGGAPGAPAGGAAADAKRKRDGEAGSKGGKGQQEKELTKEEREFMARREAARQRVQQRTAASFGLV